MTAPTATSGGGGAPCRGRRRGCDTGSDDDPAGGEGDERDRSGTTAAMNFTSVIEGGDSSIDVGRYRNTTDSVDDDQHGGDGSGGSYQVNFAPEDFSAVPGIHGTLAEQGDETEYDDREDADDDLGKGRIKFPPGLYGREVEVGALLDAYGEIASASEADENGGGCSGDELIVGGGAGSSSVGAVFVGGGCGVGKSALVAEAIRRLEAEARAPTPTARARRPRPRPLFAAGKFSHAENGAAAVAAGASAPLSAAADAFGSLASQLVEDSSAGELRSIRKRLERAGLAIGGGDRGGGRSPRSSAGDVLVRSFPGVAPLLTTSGHHDPSADDGGESLPTVGGMRISTLHAQCRDAPLLTQSAARLFLSALFGRNDDDGADGDKDDEGDGGFSLNRHLILFLDDLQWADEASLRLLASLLSRGGPEGLSAPLRRILFVGAYRDNEVGDSHPLRDVMSEADRGSASAFISVRHLKLGPLTKATVRSFVADCVSRDDNPDEAAPLADAVFSRTMGNAFFVRQAMTELVRKNVLYYDIMCFQWMWSAGEDGVEVDLGEELTDDVRKMILSKMDDLPPTLRRALILAACARNSFDDWTLLALLQADAGSRGTASIEMPELHALLDLAVEEGLLLLRRDEHQQQRRRRRERQCFGFAHDQIYDAARSYADDLDPLERERLSVVVGAVLRALHAEAEASSQDGDDNDKGAEDWMLHVAVDHLNAVPRDYADADLLAVDLARLNLRVAELSRCKAAFGQAVDLLRHGIQCLGDDDSWTGPHYDLTLEMHNLLLRVEFAKGSYESAGDTACCVLGNARCSKDMFAAHLTLVQNISQGEDKDYDLATTEALEILEFYGYKFPQQPTKMDLVREEAMLKVQLKGRPIKAVSEVTRVMEEEEAVMMLLDEASTAAMACRNQRLATMIALRAMRIALVKGVSKYLATFSITLGLPHREGERFQKAFARGNLAWQILDRLAEDKGYEYAYAKIRLHNSLLHLRYSFKDSLDTYAEAYEILMAYGSVDLALSVPMTYTFCCFAEGFHLHSSLEAKLTKSELQSRALGRPNMVAIFQLFRQFLLNLQGKGFEAPTVLKGRAFDEDKVLGRLEGNSKKMMLRDTNIFRLQLAVIFGDLDAMETALQELITIPIYDRLIVRQHLRLCFVGLASFILGRRRRRKEYTKMGQKILRHFEKLSNSGSVNARPVVWCLLAAKIPGRENYDKAIQACSSSQVLHLEALMTEHCGLLFEAQRNRDMAAEYLEKSLGLYTDWGAFAKANQLRERHDFLRGVQSRKGATATETSVQTFSLMPVS